MVLNMKWPEMGVDLLKNAYDKGALQASWFQVSGYCCAGTRLALVSTIQLRALHVSPPLHPLRKPQKYNLNVG